MLRQRRSSTVRRVLTTGAVAIVASGAVLVGLAPAAHATGADDSAILGHLDALRAAHGLRGLSEASDLNAVAAGHTAAMAAAGTIFHNPALTSEVGNWRVLGENVGMGPSASAIDAAFDASPDHYANEVNPAYTQVGIATARDSRGYLYITVDFRAPRAGSTPPPAPVVHHAPVAPRPVARPVVHPAVRPVAAPVARPVVRAAAVPRAAPVARTVPVVATTPAAPSMLQTLMADGRMMVMMVMRVAAAVLG